MFVDEAYVDVQAGRGGNGAVAFRREKYVPLGGPSGGNGGRGGDVILVATRNAHTLSRFRHVRRLKAVDGRPGGPKDMTGATGADERVNVPLGTVVYETESGDLLGDLTVEGQTLVVARGGDGGRGNASYTSSTNRAPRKFTPGREGDCLRLRLELKLIADVALVGFPSVGKSTIIAAMSNARPKIAAYPFTTLAPNLGVVKWRDYGELVVADIPGLIEGAHEGQGLGIQFLRHIERTKLIVHVIEVVPSAEDAVWEGRSPLDDLDVIAGELRAFNSDLASRPAIVVLNKVDLPDARAAVEGLRAIIEGEREMIFVPISAATGEGLGELKDVLGRAIVQGDTRLTRAKS
jgi:GTP-binding protein